MVPLLVAGTLLREVLRALTTPVRLLCYLPRRHHWRRLASATLAAAAAAPTAAEPDDLLQRLRARRRPRPHAADRRPVLFVSAGEASGEAHAAHLVRALGSDIRCRAFGGPLLQAAGAEVRFPLSEHAVMGFFAVLAQLPLLVRAYATFLRLLRDDPPDLVVLVDYPGLHLVMAKACRRRGVPVLHYVAPQYWAWGPWRMRRYRRAVDATLTILPFETAFFRRFGVPARYIGHPLLDQPPDQATTAATTADGRPILCLLPGSRRREIEANLPGMLQVARGLAREVADLRVVLAHRDPNRAPLLRELLQRHDAAFVEFAPGPLQPWLQRARVVLAKSGTGSLEACLHGNPVVVVYRLRGLLASIGYHSILSVPFVAAANLIAGRSVVPEFCFARARGWERVLQAVRELWHDGSARERCRQGLAEVRARLGAPGATARTAALVRAVLAAEAP